MRLLFILNIFMMFFSSLNAQSTITFNKNVHSFKSFNMEIYEDKSAKLSFTEIQKIKEFKTINNRISEGYSHSNIWLKFKVKNDTKSVFDSILFFTENMVHFLDCYIIDEDNSVKHYQEGIGYFKEGHLNKLDNPKFKITFEKNESKIIYIRMYSIYPNVGAFYLFDEKEFLHSTILYNNIYSAYFGAILSLILYNLFLFLFSKEISYILYVLLLISYLLWQLTMNSFPPFNSFNTIDGYYLAGTPVNFMIIFIILFSRNLLSTKEEFPKLDKIMLVFLTLVIFFTLIVFIFNVNTTFYINLLAMVIFPFLLYLGFKSYFNHNKIAIFFIIAEIAFLVSSTIYSFMMQGLLPYTLFTRHSIAVGVGIELILFSLSLGYSIRLLKDEKSHILFTISKGEEERRLLKQSRLAQMGEMMSMIAHQWRQPLSAISATSSALELRAKLNKLDNETVIKLSSKISNYSQHLSTTINDFRDFFKSDKEKKEITYNELILSVLNIVEVSMVNKNIEIKKELKSEKVFISYPNEIKQVLLNLIKNAEDILLENKVKDPLILIKTDENYLTIEDNGGGIESHLIDKIFDPYFSTKLEKNGTGLGLYMSKIIIEEHCLGQLSVKNTEEGAIFTIAL